MPEPKKIPCFRGRKQGMEGIVLFNSRNVEYNGKIVNDFKELAEMLKI